MIVMEKLLSSLELSPNGLPKNPGVFKLTYVNCCGYEDVGQKNELNKSC